MQKTRKSQPTGKMRKYYQLMLVLICFVSVISLLIYRHEYYRLRYVLEVLNFFGKPGLSEVEFCGPGYNATLLSEMMRNSSIEVKKSPPIFQQLDDHFYVFSSFLRHNPKYKQLTAEETFASDSIVIGKNNIVPKFRCHFWYDKNTNKPLKGKFFYKAIEPSESGYQMYIFYCSLSSNFGKPNALSFYSNDNDVNPLMSPILKLINVDTNKKRMNKESKFINSIDISVCVMPNKIPIISKESLIEFLAYHQLVGVDEFIIYDSTISQDAIKRLDLISPDISKWRLTFFPLNYPFIFAKAYNIIKRAVELDCFYRTLEENSQYKSSHLGILSWDEFIVPRNHQSLKSFLTDYNVMKQNKNIVMKSQLFCMNQPNDPKIKLDFPEFIKKTHYYTIDGFNESAVFYNLDANMNVNDITNKSIISKPVKDDLIAVHKYTNCYDEHSFSNGGDFLNTKPNRFEGAMLKFADSLHNNRLFRMFKSGQIWDKSTEKFREML